MRPVVASQRMLDTIYKLLKEEMGAMVVMEEMGVMGAI